MEKIIFVEILNRRNRIKSRIRLNNFPVTIGRAYTNNIIIDDRFIDPEHVRLSFDEGGNLVAEDLGSKNGLHQLKPLKRVKSVIILPGTQIRVGHTVLRFRSPDYNVGPAEVKLYEQTAFQRFLKSKSAGLAVFLFSLVVLMASDFLGSYDRFTFAKFLSNFLPVLLIFAMWAGCWSFANRVVSHEFHFISHLAVLSTAVIGFLFFIEAIGYYAFLFSPGVFLDVVEIMGLALISTLFLYGHLSVASTVSRVWRLISSSLIAFGLFGLFGYIDYVERAEFSNAIEFYADLKPINVHLLPTVSTEAFFKDSRDLKEKVDAFAKEE